MWKEFKVNCQKGERERLVKNLLRCKAGSTTDSLYSNHYCQCHDILTGIAGWTLPAICVYKIGQGFLQVTYCIGYFHKVY